MSKHRLKTVLCFGDSNTWGYNPANGSRFGYNERWPGIMRQNLGDGFVVIEEGLNHRTTLWDDPIQPYKNGKTYLIPCLDSHKPLDLVFLMLGSNDLKARFDVNASDIAESAGLLVDIIQRSGSGHGGFAPKVVLMSPPPFSVLTDLQEMFEGWEEKFQTISDQFRITAESRGVNFLDTSQYVASSELDGIHLDAGAHRKLGQVATSLAREIL